MQNKTFSRNKVVKVSVVVHVSKVPEVHEVEFRTGRCGLGRGRYSKAKQTVTYVGYLNLENLFDLLAEISTWDSGCLQKAELSAHKIELWY